MTSQSPTNCRCGHAMAHHSATACWFDEYCDCNPVGTTTPDAGAKGNGLDLHPGDVLTVGGGKLDIDHSAHATTPSDFQDELMTILENEFAFGRKSGIGDAALAAITALFERVIGEDEVRADTLYNKGIEHFEKQRAIPYRNALRAELRAAIDQLHNTIGGRDE